MYTHETCFKYWTLSLHSGAKKRGPWARQSFPCKQTLLRGCYSTRAAFRHRNHHHRSVLRSVRRIECVEWNDITSAAARFCSTPWYPYSSPGLSYTNEGLFFSFEHITSHLRQKPKRTVDPMGIRPGTSGVSLGKDETPPVQDYRMKNPFAARAFPGTKGSCCVMVSRRTRQMEPRLTERNKILSLSSTGTSRHLP